MKKYSKWRETMENINEVQFKTLLTLEEYNRLIEKFKGSRSDNQTNHYFDTSRFSLKALGASLRVRERDNFEITLKRKKGYNLQEITLPISEEIFLEVKNTGVLPDNEIKTELTPLIGEQKLINFFSLSTERIYLHYKSGIIFIDKSEYLNSVDYELSYLGKKSNETKKEFIQLISELGIQYKKSEKKIKRAFNAFKKLY